MSSHKRVPRRIKLKRSKPKRADLSGMIVLGVGLMFVGSAALLLWPRPEVAASSPISNGSYTTIPVEVNYEAPELTLTAVDGTEQSLADYRGQVVLVNLWATWCPPCKAEMPTLEAFYKAHAVDGFVTIAISSGDPADAVEEFVDNYGLTFQVWLDPNIDSGMAFRTQSLPSSFVIDRDGQVRLRWVGEINRDTLEKYVTPLIVE